MPLGAALDKKLNRGRATENVEGYLALTNSKFYLMFSRSEAVGSKFHCQKGKSPDCHLRPQNHNFSVKKVELFRQPGGWLRSSHPLKKA
jgi:hypothetical protein